MPIDGELHEPEMWPEDFETIEPDPATGNTRPAEEAK